MKTNKKFLKSALAASLLLSAAIPFNVLAEGKTISIEDAEKILAGLTAEQRQALEELEIGPGFVVSPDINTKSSELVDIIVEFNQAPAKVEVKKAALKNKKMSLAAAKEKVENSHKDFKDYIKAFKSKKSETIYDPSKIAIKREYKNAFNGVSMTLPGTAVEELLQSGAVKRIWSNAQVQLELPPKSQIQPKMADSIPQIGVDKLHAENITGKGIKVGVLDTGMDYNHPDLAASYKGYRSQSGVDPQTIDPATVKGWDFVNNDADPMETTYKEWQATKDPEFHPATGGAYYTSHGTHVSGTIAAQKHNKVDYAVKGVAPDVDLYAYKVLGPYGSGTTEGVLAGIDKAVQDEMDVINLSLGASVNDPLYPTSVAINNAMLSGVVAVVAAGNAGPNEKTLGSPGASAFGITVGASDAAISIPAFSASIGDKTFESMKLLGKNFTDNLKSLEGQSYPIVFAGLGKPEEFKEASGKIALIERGELTFDAKVENAKNAGAAAVIIFNNVDGDIPTYIGENTKYIPTLQLSKADGEYVKGLSDAVVSFNKLAEVKTEGDSLADFSSRGPVEGNYDIKPDIVAPGVSIFSTYPEYMNNPQDGIDYSSAYARLQGTSMATPHISGVAALILQEHPDMDPFAVKAAIMNTAEDLKSDYSVYEAGAGRVDAYQAVHTNVSFKVLDKTDNIENGEYVKVDDITGSISYGNHYLDGADVKDSRSIQVTNNGQQDQVYQVEVEYHTARTGVQDGVKNKIHVNTPESVTVGAGQSTAIQAEIMVPQSAEKGRYEGYLHFVNQADPKDRYQIPFAIRVSDKGIEYMEPLSPSVTNDTTFHQYMAPGSHIVFKLKSPMEYFDLIVKDAKTGKAVGYIGRYDGKRALPDKEYLIFFGHRGLVYPFTNKKDQPIADYMMKLPEGEYVLDMIGTDAEGKTYHYDSVGIVDNTPPQVKLDIEPGVIEINDSMLTEEDGQRAFWAHGAVTDSTVDVLQAKGLNFTQKSNTAAYYENGIPFIMGFLRLDDNGNTKFGVLPEEYDTNPYQLKIFPWDIATAANSATAPQYIFMKEGTEYAASRYDKESVKLGDEITMTMDLNNVKNFMGGQFELETYASDIYEFQGVKVNKEFQALADKNGVEVKLDEPVVNQSVTKVGASLSKEGFTGFDGDMPFLDLTFKVVKDTLFNRNGGFSLNELTYQKYGQTAPAKIPAYSLTSFEFISKHTLISGNIGPEAFLTASGYIDNKYDFTKLKSKVYAKDADGVEYPAEMDNRGLFDIIVPATGKPVTVYVELPGHTVELQKVMSSIEKDGEYYGIYQRIVPGKNKAGDVTGDQVIDIRDIKQVVEHYGEQKPSDPNLDVNQDGVVNEVDVRFVEKNFSYIGPKAGKGASAKETIGKKGLADFLKSVGLEPEGE